MHCSILQRQHAAPHHSRTQSVSRDTRSASQVCVQLGGVGAAVHAWGVARPVEVAGGAAGAGETSVKLAQCESD